MEKTRYEVAVVTGDRKYAGTDANVYLEITGKHGKTGEIKLDDNKNNFEKGQTDIFKVGRSLCNSPNYSFRYFAVLIIASIF